MRQSSSSRRRRCTHGRTSPTSTSSRPPVPPISRSRTTAPCRPYLRLLVQFGRDRFRDSQHQHRLGYHRRRRQRRQDRHRQLRLSDLHPRNRTCARPRPPGPIQRQRVYCDQRALRQRYLAIFDHVVFLGAKLFRELAIATWSRRRWRTSTPSASIYGAATTTRTGDTVYGFNSNAGAVFNFGNYTSAPALTIYDSGGTDTLDCSGYSAAQTIDLHAGSLFVDRRPRQQYRDRAQRRHRESDRRQRQRHADRERCKLHTIRRRRCRYADWRRRQRQADRRHRASTI